MVRKALTPIAIAAAQPRPPRLSSSEDVETHLLVCIAEFALSQFDYAAAGGPRLLEFLDGLPLATRWLHGHHVVWQTGQQNAPEGYGHERHTHCSAFVAAVALMLDVYILRPPNHRQNDLANAQGDWLAGRVAYVGPTAIASGWESLGVSGDRGALRLAVEHANSGRLVVCLYRTPADQGKPGHICIVRPQSFSGSSSGPLVMSVGERNHSSVHMQSAFGSHPGAWPNEIELYAVNTALQHDFR